MQEKPPLWQRDPARYRDKAKKRIARLSVVDPETGCWIWRGAVNVGPNNAHVQRKSYEARRRPYLFYKGHNRLAYRVSYELWVGDIPDGLGMDHTCGRQLCVRPDHVEPVTTQENTKRYWARRREAERANRESAKETRRHPMFGGEK